MGPRTDPARGGEAPAPRRRGWVLVRDVLVVALVARLTFSALCRYVGDYYRVPSGSMEPLLHGDPDAGDVVYVGALASAAGCGRHDLVVVWHPDDPDGLLVKRLVAVGDDPAACYVSLLEGDVWLGGDRQRLAREVKDPLASRGMRVPWARWPEAAAAGGLELSAATVVDGRLRLPPLAPDRAALRALLRERAAAGEEAGLLAGAVGTARVVDATYLAVTGQRGREGQDVGVFDCGMELEVTVAPATLVLGLETRRDAVTFLWQPATGALLLWRNGEDVADATLPAVTGAHRVEFGRLDGRLFFAVDGRADAVFCYPRPAAWDRPDAELPRGPRSRLSVAALGGPAELGGLGVFRDVFYVRDRIVGVPGQPETWPVFVEPGRWFLLGDNAYDSRDSRFFGSVPASSFVGRPWFVLGPWPRQRWLDR